MVSTGRGLWRGDLVRYSENREDDRYQVHKTHPGGKRPLMHYFAGRIFKLGQAGEGLTGEFRAVMKG